MSIISFENDKFIPAPLPEICAPRHELLNLYYRAAENRLAVVCSPAGYGKTVSTLLWVKNSGRRSVWIGLDEYDNAPFVFYKTFCTGILSVQPGNKKMEKLLKSETFYSAPVEHTINLLLELVPDGRSYALIFDDLHKITNKRILKSLPLILKRLPHSFVVLLLSRSSLPKEFKEFVESRKGILITANELAFSAEEIRNYYNALGRSITKAQAQAVFGTTGGWAIGINVLSQSDYLKAPQKGGQILENYIEKNVWEKWSEELREFMLVSSVANEMDAGLCSILTGKKNADETLEKLVEQNLFAFKTSVGTYRYHHLFLEFLRNKLKERPDINVRALNMKIADLYFDRQNFFEALDYYVKAEDHQGISMCYYELNANYLDFSVEEWLNYYMVYIYDNLSEEFIKNNLTLFAESVWANFLNGNAEATLRYIDLFNDYLTSKDNPGMFLENDIIGFACTIWFADFRRNIYEYAEDFSKWVSTLPERNSEGIEIYTTTITQNFPLMHRSVFDCLEIVSDMDNRLQAIRKAFGTLFHKEVDVFFYCVKAGLYYELNHLEKAHEAIMLAQNELKTDLRFEMHFCVFMLLSQVLYAIGKTKESESTRTYFSQRMQEENALYLNPNFLAVDIKHRLWDADREAARMWLEQHFITEDEQLRFYKLWHYFTTARAYIVLSEKEKAMDYLVKLENLNTDYNRPLDAAEAGVLQAVLKWAIGFRKEAVQMLEDIMVALQPYSAIRIIADEGAAVLPILKKIAVKTARADYQGQLDGRYLNQVLLCAYEVSKRHKGIATHFNEKPVKLSKQQKYVLTLLAQGYKNAEIINITGLTINTIKAHTKIIFSKLNVNKAADAIIEAKRLGLIES